MRMIVRRLFPARRRWLLIAIMWLAVALLTFSALAAHPGADPHRTTLDNIYVTLQVFGLGFPIDLAAVDWRLQVARFAGPAVTASAFLQASAVLFRDQLAHARLRFARGHVVVCGLGDKGYRLASGFAAAGRSVVGIDRDLSAAHLGAARSRGITVLTGSATDPSILAMARVGTAAEVIATCGDDGTNAEIAAQVRSLQPPHRDPPVRCSVHLLDAQLCSLLRHQSLRDTGSGMRVEFFNIYQSGARLWLGDGSPFDAATAPHLVIIGLDELGQSLTVSAVQRWADRGPDAGNLRVTLVDADASGRLQAIRLRHPSLAEHCELATIDLDPANPSASAVDEFDALFRDAEPTAVYVCFDDDARSLSIGLDARHRLRGRAALVAVRTRSDRGLAVLLRGGATPGGDMGVRGFGLLDRACTVDVIEGGAHEQVARGIHDDYRARNPGSALAVPWDELPAGARESNRQAADHIAAGLHEIGCDLIPLHRWGGAAFVLTPAEVEVLAAREHARWKAEREKAGWRHGPVRDDDTRQNPLLVPWEALDEAARQANRDAVAELPATLARAGFEIVRTGA